MLQQEHPSLDEALDHITRLESDNYYVIGLIELNDIYTVLYTWEV